MTDDYNARWATYNILRRATDAVFRARCEVRGTEAWAACVKAHLLMEEATEAERKRANGETEVKSLAVEMLKDGSATLAQTNWVMHPGYND